jgi:hypothetical protein
MSLNEEALLNSPVATFASGMQRLTQIVDWIRMKGR